MSASALCPALALYEVLLEGFDGGTDESDDKVLWVAAPSAQMVQDEIKDTGAMFIGEVEGAYLADADYVLPGARLNFQSHLNKAASDFRNQNRAC